MTQFPCHGRIDGPIVMIGFGSIGRGTLPLIERHFEYDARKVHVIEPELSDHTFLAQRGIRHHEVALTPDNYREVLGAIFEPGTGFCVNLSVDVSSLDILRFCREMGVLYIDTVVEPWAGFYFDTTDNAARTNYTLRQAVRDEKARNPGGPTAVSCCGANPGMVSWFVKEALMRLVQDTGRSDPMPDSREGWARLMQSLGVRGIHVAERDTQKSTRHKRIGTFVNTWSVAPSSTPGRSRASSRKASSPPNSAGARTRPGSPRTATATRPAAGPRSGLRAPARSPASTPGARRPARSTASSSPTTRRSRSRTTTRWATGRTRSIARPATTPITPATMPSCRCTRPSARA